MFGFRKTRRRRKLGRAGLEARRKRRAQAANQPTAGAGDPKPPVPWLIPVFIGILVWFVVTASIVYRRAYISYQYVPGQIADRNIYSEVDFDYTDAAETRRLRERAAQRVPPTYRIDRYKQDKALHRLDLLKKWALAPPEKKGLPALHRFEGADAEFQALLSALPPRQHAALEYLAHNPDRWKYLAQRVADTLARGICNPKEISAEPQPGKPRAAGKICIIDTRARKVIIPVAEALTPKAAGTRLADEFARQFPENSGTLKQALRSVLPAILLPNLSYDADATDAAREAARQRVAPVRRRVRAQTLLLRRGAKVTEDDLARLKAHEEALRDRGEASLAPKNVIVFSLLCLLLVGASAWGLAVVRPEAIRRNSSLCLIAAAAILQVVLCRITADLYYVVGSSAVNLFPLIPLSFGAMLLSPIEGVRVALVQGLFSGAIVALQNGRSFDLALIGAISSLAAALSIRRARRRNHIFRTGLAVGGVIFVTYGLVAVYNGVPLSQLPRILGLGIANGIGSATLVYFMLPLFEHIFGRTTDMTLIELSDLNHPLLKRLQMEAPGTYHHSLMVATIAEQAAEAIGANPLLARVCAYFHDIGKLAHPEYFVENQFGPNPHEALQPRMSTRVILNHVKEGLELARKHHLQRAIREGIAQHHGTSLVYYFYRRALDQACAEGKKSDIGEQDYRYPGPCPVRKEITIISLADACEAAGRTLEKPSPQRITQLVDELTYQRFRDGQFSNSELTFREMTIVRASIARTLANMLHARIPYPEKAPDHADQNHQAQREPENSRPPAPDSGNPPNPPAGKV